MPRIDYKCSQCNTNIEKTFSIKEEYPITIQCTCKGIAKRIWSSVNFKIVGGTPHHLTERAYYKETDDALNEYNARKKWEMPNYDFQPYKPPKEK